MMTVMFISVSIVAAVAGQIVLKHGMTRMGVQSLTLSPSGVFDVMWRIATSPWIVLGIAIYVSGTFFWLMVLSRVDLSFAYPMTSMSYILIVLSSWLILGEAISPLRIAGVMTVCVGVLLISQS